VASPIIYNKNTSSNDIECTVKCVVTFESGLTAEATKNFKMLKQTVSYYWYVGQTNPASMTSISPIVTSGLGWREIGTILPTYNSSNKLYDGTWMDIDLTEEKYYWYLMIPVKCNALPRDGFGGEASSVGICEKQGTKTISGVEYQIYKSSGEMFGFDVPIY
jgi:hypothetical protein